MRWRASSRSKEEKVTGLTALCSVDNRYCSNREEKRQRNRGGLNPMNFSDLCTCLTKQ